MHSPVLIVGGGLSALRLASLLANDHIPFTLLETRNRLGGRVLTHFEPPYNYFDLGPTWYWPENEPVIAQLIEDLNLPVTAQYNTGILYWISQAMNCQK